MRLVQAYYGTRPISKGYLGTKPLEIGGIIELITDVTTDIISTASVAVALSRYFDKLASTNTIDIRSQIDDGVVISQYKDYLSSDSVNLTDISQIVFIPTGVLPLSSSEQDSIVSSSTVNLSKLSISSVASHDKTKILSQYKIDLSGIFIQNLVALLTSKLTAIPEVNINTVNSSLLEVDNALDNVRSYVDISMNSQKIIEMIQDDKVDMIAHSFMNGVSLVSSIIKGEINTDIQTNSKFSIEASKLEEVPSSFQNITLVSYCTEILSLYVVQLMPTVDSDIHFQSFNKLNVNSVRYSSLSELLSNTNLSSDVTISLISNIIQRLISKQDTVQISVYPNMVLQAVEFEPVDNTDLSTDVQGNTHIYFITVWAYLKDGYLHVPRACSIEGDSPPESNEFIIIN